MPDPSILHPDRSGQSPLPVCDCHIHIFDGQSGAAGVYKPAARSVADYLRETGPTGISRAVIIQASVDGTDNSRLVETLRSSPGLTLRGVATIGAESTGLQAMAAAGVRALRIQDRKRLGRQDLAHLPILATRAAEVDWHVELNTEPERFDALLSMIPSLPSDLTIVLDHIGHVDPHDPKQVETLLRVIETGNVWVKLSPTRVSRDIGRYRDLVNLVRRLVEAHGERCIWGSDWPHVMTEPPLPDMASMLDFMASTLTREQRVDCLVANPERLYRF